MINKKVIVILSGGMDSGTLIYDLKQNYQEVKAISFNYGQKHKKELQFAEKICKKLEVNHKIVDITCINELLQGSALTTENIFVPEGHYKEENMKLTVVPNRNMILASISIGYAIAEKFDSVALGFHSGDYTIYPDCRPLFVDTLKVISRIANYEEIEIITPYLEMDKETIIKRGVKLGVDYSLTWTCYKGGKIACGKCGSCQERLEGFRKNKLKDPIEYLTKKIKKN